MRGDIREIIDKMAKLQDSGLSVMRSNPSPLMIISQKVHKCFFMKCIPATSTMLMSWNSPGYPRFMLSRISLRPSPKSSGQNSVSVDGIV